MTVNLTWHIDRVTSDANTGRISSIDYRILGEKDGTYHDFCGIVVLTGDVVTPFEDVTEEQAIAWAKEALGKELKFEQEQIASLDAEVDEEGNPVIDEAAVFDLDHWTTIATEKAEEQVCCRFEPPTENSALPWA